MSNNVNPSPSDLAKSRAGAPVLHTISAYQTTATAEVAASIIADRPYLISGVRMHVVTSGSAGTTTVVINKNESAVAGATASVANTDPDGTTVAIGPSAATTLDPGDRVNIEVTAAATAGAGVTLELILQECFV